MVTADGAYISKVPGTSGKWMLTNITGNVVITITGGNTSEIITELQLAYADYLTGPTSSDCSVVHIQVQNFDIGSHERLPESINLNGVVLGCLLNQLGGGGKRDCSCHQQHGA